jgi:hypothetical protein
VADSVETVELEDIECRDPECDGTAELEMDGLTRYYSCATCGFEFGYERVRQEVDTCAVGVPEGLRRAASGPMEQALAEQQQKRMLPLTVVRKEPEHGRE